MNSNQASMIPELVGDILQSGYQGVLVVTGAGSQGIAWLLAVPGASAFLLEALIPYSQASLVQFLGQEPEQFVAAETARAMAERAYERATRLAPDASKRVGLACTATIATHRPKRGPHWAHLAARTDDRIVQAWLELDKGRRTRVEEEAVVSQALLGLLAWVCGVRPEVELELGPGDQWAMAEGQNP